MLRFAAEAPDAASVLIPTVGMVVVAVIGGAVSIITSRRPANTQTQEPHAVLPREMTEFYDAELARKDARIAELEDSEETWMLRAYDSGWRP